VGKRHNIKRLRERRDDNERVRGGEKGRRRSVQSVLISTRAQEEQRTSGKKGSRHDAVGVANKLVGRLWCRRNRLKSKFLSEKEGVPPEIMGVYREGEHKKGGNAV